MDNNNNNINNNNTIPRMPDAINDDRSNNTNSHADQINRFVILQFGEGAQQDVIIDYRDNIRNAILEQRRRQLSSVTSSRQPMTMAPTTTSATPSTAESAPVGVRGIDFPAFDVTSEGVFGANRTSSRFLDLLRPGGAADIFTPANAEPSSSQTSETETGMPFSTTSSNANGGSNRNIILTVNYEYSSGVDQEEARDRSASLVLNVPNVPQGEDENRLQALIRFATIIAFRTIAMSLQNKQRGISEEQFAKLKIKSLGEIKEKSCPICYDDLEEPSKKRRRDDDEEEEEEEIEKPSKATKDLNNNKVPTSDTQKQEAKTAEVRYTHIPVEMPCKHVFGQDCLHEWLKANNSCPLCRYKLYDENRNSDGIQTTTMNLPNLARFLNDNSRDSLLNGEINRLPMLVVSNDSDPSTAAESLNNDLRNSLNNVPIIVTTAPTTIPMVSALPVSPPPAGLSSGAGWNRFTRENIVRRIINSLTNSVGVSQPTATSSSLGVRSHLPILPSFREQAAQRRERANRRAAGGSPPHSTGLEFVNRDPLFPVGVSSRRTANGVETVNVSGERPVPEDYAIQDSIVNDLLYGGGVSSRGARRDDDANNTPSPVTTSNNETESGVNNADIARSGVPENTTNNTDSNDNTTS